jgi:hypothetical protein
MTSRTIHTRLNIRAARAFLSLPRGIETGPTRRLIRPTRHGRACPGHPRSCLVARKKDVDGRDKPGHDGEKLRGVVIASRIIHTHLHILAASFRARFTSHGASETSEGAGNAGRSTPRSLACKNKKHTSIVTTVTPDSSGIPRAMVLTVSFVISPVIGLCCHRHQRNEIPPT